MKNRVPIDPKGGNKLRSVRLGAPTFSTESRDQITILTHRKSCPNEIRKVFNLFDELASDFYHLSVIVYTVRRSLRFPSDFQHNSERFWIYNWADT